MVDIDNLSKQKIMQLYQDQGMILGLELAKVDIDERIKSIQIGIEQFMKDNNITEDTVVEMD